MPNSIALFTWGISQSHGAITNIVASLARAFLKLGIQNIYIVYLNDAEDQRIELPKEVQLIPLKVNQTKLSSLAIAKFIKSYEPDIFISLAFLNIPSIIGYILAGKIKTKLIISQQNSMIYQAKIEHQGNWLFAAQVWLARYLYPQADGLVATTNPVLNELINHIGITFKQTKTKVIPNILDINKISLQAQGSSNHPWLQKKSTPVIISVARLAKQKNFPLLLSALKATRRQVEVKLIIFGEGKERKNLENLVKQFGLENAVSLPGYCAIPYQEMAKADAFVLSSEEEAFGLVLVEAMASGTPVIATDAFGEGPRTILEDGQYGLLVSNLDQKALSEAIIKILTNVDLRDRLIAAGKKRCQFYRPDIIAQEWLSFLEEVCQAP